jgi:hypothetical protein
MVAACAMLIFAGISLAGFIVVAILGYASPARFEKTAEYFARWQNIVTGAAAVAVALYVNQVVQAQWSQAFLPAVFGRELALFSEQQRLQELRDLSVFSGEAGRKEFLTKIASYEQAHDPFRTSPGLALPKREMIELAIKLGNSSDPAMKNEVARQFYNSIDALIEETKSWFEAAQRYRLDRESAAGVPPIVRH